MIESVTALSLILIFESRALILKSKVQILLSTLLGSGRLTHPIFIIFEASLNSLTIPISVRLKNMTRTASIPILGSKFNFNLYFLNIKI